MLGYKFIHNLHAKYCATVCRRTYLKNLVVPSVQSFLEALVIQVVCHCHVFNILWGFPSPESWKVKGAAGLALMLVQCSDPLPFVQLL